MQEVKYLPELKEICQDGTIYREVRAAVADALKDAGKYALITTWHGITKLSFVAGLTGALTGVIFLIIGEHQKGKKIVAISTVGYVFVQAIDFLAELNK